jgi:hypothetical protein
LARQCFNVEMVAIRKHSVAKSLTHELRTATQETFCCRMVEGRVVLSERAQDVTGDGLVASAQFGPLDMIVRVVEPSFFSAET